MPDFLLPDLGEGLEEAEIVRWHVRPGDQVTVDQVVVEVETAKAAVEVPVPFAGTVARLHAEPGGMVKVGRPLISVDPVISSERVGEPGAIVPTVSPTEDASGSVLIGYGTGSASTPRRRRARVPVRDTAATTPPPAASVAVISPLVRRQAHAAGIDLATIRGSGPSGVIRRSDLAAAASPPIETHPGENRIPLRGLRRTVADKLSRSRREIPEATVWVDVDATALLATRAALKAADGGRPVSVLALLARFTVLALRRYPELNGRVEGDEIVLADHVNLGFAAQTERGLMVPVVHGAHLLSTRDLSAALAERVAAARAGSLQPADLTGGTVTVNNYGVFGVDGSAAIINHPEVAIVGLGRLIDRPWVVDGHVTVRAVSQLTLSFDHRVCDGGTAGGFLRYLADCIEAPIIALGDL